MDKNRFHRGEIAAEIALEATRAAEIHPPFHSKHEGYAGILEELDELWDEIKKKHSDKSAMRIEAIQVGAMALRFIEDVIDKLPEASK
jgi:hypothetical protein